MDFEKLKTSGRFDIHNPLCSFVNYARYNDSIKQPPNCMELLSPRQLGNSSQ